MSIIDTVSQYLHNSNIPIVRQGSGYVAKPFAGIRSQKSNPREYISYVEPVQVPEYHMETPKLKRTSILDRVDEYLSGKINSMFPGITVSGTGPAFDAPPIIPVAQASEQEVAPVQTTASLDSSIQSYLENNIFPLTDAYGIPRSLAAAQWALESGRGSSDAAVNMNNPFGLGPNVNYNSLDDAIRDYDMTLRSIIGYNKGFNDKYTQPEDFSYSNYTPEDLAWSLMFTDLADRKALEGNPLYGDPNASQYRYEADSSIPDYVSLLMNTPEWNYYY